MADLVPPQGVRTAAQRGIALVAAGKAGDGFMSATLERARKIAAGHELTPDHVKRMHSFFARHAVDRKPDWGKAGQETPGYVAWMAWGGDPGASWSARVSEQLKREQMTETVFAIDDRTFHFHLSESEASVLELLLEHVTQGHERWQQRRFIESSEDFKQTLSSARSVVQSLADEAQAQGDSTAEYDRMVVELTAMMRRVLTADEQLKRAHAAALATYEQEHGPLQEHEDVASYDGTDDTGVVPMTTERTSEDLSMDYNDRQIAQIHALDEIVAEFGKYTQDEHADGAHYMPVGKNPFAERGVKCGNCAFYEAPGCELVQGRVEPEGVCKLWVIPGAKIIDPMPNSD